MVQPSEIAWRVPTELNIILISKPSHHPWYLPKGAENLHTHKTYTPVFIVTLFIIAKSRKQPSCPSVGE